MRVVVTRPQQEAAGWLRVLQDAGWDTLALPLIAIGPLADPEPLRRAWMALEQTDAVMFVSAGAVQHFFEQNPTPGRMDAWVGATKTRAFVTGPGSRAALLRVGVAPERIDSPQAPGDAFDSESLWRIVAPQVRPGWRVLIVRGAHSGDSPQGAGRDWFGEQLRGAGAQVQWLAAYQRALPQLAPALLAQARGAAQDGSVWLFSSSEAIANLQVLLPQQDWSRTPCVATHARIAAAANAAGFSPVRLATSEPANLLASIESLA